MGLRGEQIEFSKSKLCAALLVGRISGMSFRHVCRLPGLHGRRMFASSKEYMNKRLEREAREQAEAAMPLQSAGSIGMMLVIIGLPGAAIAAIATNPPPKPYIPEDDDEGGLADFSDYSLSAGDAAADVAAFASISCLFFFR